MSYHIYKTRGLVLGSFANGEADRSFRIFTEDFGLIFASAKSVRSHLSKLRSHLDDFSLSELSLIKGKNKWKLTGALSNRNFYRDFENNKNKKVLCGKIFLLVQTLLSGEEKNSELFLIVSENLDNLLVKDFSEEELRVVEALIVLRILHNLGFVDGRGYVPEIFNSEINRELIDSTKTSFKNIVLSINKALKASR